MLKIVLIAALMFAGMPRAAAAGNGAEVAAGAILGMIIGGAIVRSQRPQPAPVYVVPPAVYSPAPIYVQPRVCHLYEETIVNRAFVYVMQVDSCTNRVVHQQRYYRY
jgi:hypothetical protein